MHAAIRVTFALGLALALGACRAREGAPCVRGTARCLSNTEALFCVEGRYARFECRGPAGCTGSSLSARCDESIASIGDRCSNPGGACTPDGNDFLDCVNGRLVLHAHCRGPRRCFREGRNIRCDESGGNEGDACNAEGGGACSPDGRTFLRCQGGRLVAARTCPGARGCFHENGNIRCDLVAPIVGAACSVPMSGTCSADRLDFLRCEGGQLVLHAHCGGSRHCFFEGGNVRCDESEARVGDACGVAGNGACTPDGMALLRCDGSAFVMRARCGGARHCTTEGSLAHCDESEADVGDACTAEGGAACSHDHTRRLRCRGGQFVAERSCLLRCGIVSGLAVCVGPAAR